MNQIQHELHTFLIENIAVSGEVGAIGIEEPLIETGVVDSTGLLELIAFVESTYRLTVPDEDLLPENFESIASISTYIASRSGAKA